MDGLTDVSTYLLKSYRVVSRSRWGVTLRRSLEPRSVDYWPVQYKTGRTYCETSTTTFIALILN